MATQTEVSDDAEVHRLLSELKQYTPTVGNLDQPAVVVHQLWTDLHLAWWKATVANLPLTVNESHLPNWAHWIRLQTTPAGLEVALHWVFGASWMEIGSRTKDNVYARVKTVAQRLGMDPATQGTPWLLFLFLGEEVLASVRTMRTFSAWLGHRPSLQDPALFFTTINNNCVRRHGIANIDTAPRIKMADVNYAMYLLDDTYPDTSIRSREPTRPHQTVTPAPSSGSASPLQVPDVTPVLRPRDLTLRQALPKRPRYPTTPVGVISMRGSSSTENTSSFHLGSGPGNSVERWVDGTRQSVEISRRVGEPFFDPDVSLGRSRRGTSTSSGGGGGGSLSPDELHQYVEALRIIRRVNLSSSGHDNFRAITDSLFNLAGVALSELVHEHGA